MGLHIQDPWLGRDVHRDQNSVSGSADTVPPRKILSRAHLNPKGAGRLGCYKGGIADANILKRISKRAGWKAFNRVGKRETNFFLQSETDVTPQCLRRQEERQKPFPTTKKFRIIKNFDSARKA